MLRGAGDVIPKGIIHARKINKPWSQAFYMGIGRLLGEKFVIIVEIHPQKHPAGGCAEREPRQSIIDKALHLLNADRPLLAGLHDTHEELLPVEGLAAAVLLHYKKRHCLYVFVCSEAFFTPKAGAPSTNALSFGACARIEDLVLPTSAIGAFHLFLLQSSRFDLRFAKEFARHLIGITASEDDLPYPCVYYHLRAYYAWLVCYV